MNEIRKKLDFSKTGSFCLPQPKRSIKSVTFSKQNPSSTKFGLNPTPSGINDQSGIKKWSLFLFPL